ncbi:MAG TPA: hypothetical protein VKM54_18690 [Myxococcota bacterium]|nr:hypothetical protein [Myxococcota bacterium]
MTGVRVYGCFDVRHDGDLLARLARESQKLDSPFEVTAWSAHHAESTDWEVGLRSTLANVDEVVVLCGEHTDTADEMSAELRIVQELVKPYFLLWGRRGAECTKPTTAKHADSFYAWIWEIVKSQIDIATRRRPGESVSTS